MTFLQTKIPYINSVFTTVQKNLTIVTIFIIALIVLTIDLSNKHWNKETRVIENDIKSYYAFLPAAIIYNDMSLSFADKDHEKFKYVIWNVKTATGKRAIVTTMGLSFAYLPFFLIAHIITPFTEFEADGYSLPYKFALMISCLVYLIVGLIFLKKILERYFNQYITSLTIFSIAIGTNLLLYTTHHDAPMSHVFNFALINIFLYYTIKWHEHQSFKYTIILGLISGLIALIRPTNILVLLILFFYDVRSTKDLWPRVIFFFQNYKKVFLMAILFLIVWIPQLIYWKYISGHFFYFTFDELLGETFFFNNPQIFNILFSYRKGWLLYTPIMLFALLGIPILYFKMRQFFLAILIYLLATIYVLSSWWCWWYGGSFGMRSFIDFYGILAIPFAAFINFSFERKKIPGFIVTAIVITLIWFNTFQSRQYIYGAIHWEHMTKAAYWNTFLKLYPTEEFVDLLRIPDYEMAKQGVFLEMEKSSTIEPLTREDRIQEIELYLRLNHLKMMKEKAKERDIDLDLMIKLDATWIYERELKKKK